MIKIFLKERASWILFYIGIHLFLLFTAFIDEAIPLKSILYLLLLSFFLFLLFIYYRYKKETRFYRALAEQESSLGIDKLPKAYSPFEEITEESILTQTESLRREAEKSWAGLESEKDELLSWIHEVKTPLTAMHLMLERIKDDSLRSQLVNEWLRIHLLLDQQLHHRRLPFMENDLFIEKIQLEPLINEEITNLRSWCIQRNIGFEINLDAEEVLSDGKWLSFILRQILTNAVKYSSASDIEISSSVQKEHVHLEVLNYGSFIPSRDLPRIFEKGFTSTSSHQNQASTGMGLYLANKAAGNLLIEIRTESNSETGTLFTLIFPKKNEFVSTTSM